MIRIVGTNHKYGGRRYRRYDEIDDLEMIEGHRNRIDPVWADDTGYDESPVHLFGAGYDEKCGWCYLGCGHTENAHKELTAARSMQT